MARRALSESEVLALRPVRLADWHEAAGDAPAGADPGDTAPVPAAGAATADGSVHPAAPARLVMIERPMPRVRGLRSLLARISAMTGVRRLRLDERGSFLWRRIDGERTVQELADELTAAFGEAVEPAGERVALFLRSLDREHLVELRGADGAQVKLGRT